MIFHKWAAAIALTFVAASSHARVANAAAPQVPVLPSQMAGYVKYAIDDLPEHFKNGPVAALNNTPGDNLLTDAGATLGRVLFYDKRLSHDNSVSCASCHKQENGFSDPAQFSTGIDGQQTARHSIGLSNAVYYVNGAMFWDERAESLEAQALVPIESPVEMGSSLTEVVAKLGQTEFYPQLFQQAFGSPEITPDRIGKAIAQFERAMVSYQSKYDSAFPTGSLEGNFAAVFTADELAGQALFHGEGRCAGCHSTDAQVGQQVANIGLDATVVDEGAGEGRFKTQSLRNVGVRGRFMHDGRFTSLAQVIGFYNSNVQNSEFLDQSLIDPLQLGLSAQQILQLVAFLNTLTDEQFLTSELFSDPFVTLPGDYDGNGEVDLADYNLWSADARNGGALDTDGNADGITDTADYVVWRKFFGQTWQTYGGGGQGSGGHSAPEPGTLAMAGIAIVTALGRRLRRR